MEAVAELLGLTSDPRLSVSLHRSEENVALNSLTHEEAIVALIQESVHKHLPQPPSDLESGLQRHLRAVQTVVLGELLRLCPQFEEHGLMGKLTETYHHSVFRQMDVLLREACSSKTCLQLIHWALTTYLSPDLVLHPDLQTSLISHLDLVLLSDWTTQAQEELQRLLESEVSSGLNKILENERYQQTCQSQEDYIATYIDVIKSVDAVPNEAQKISSELSLKLTKVCLNQLLEFVHSFRTHWFELLTKNKLSDQEMVKFFKTLKTCKELKKYLTQTKRKGSEVFIIEKIMVLLEEIETLTLQVLLETLSSFTESRLEKYFRSNSRHCFLMTDLEELFSPPSTRGWFSLDEHKSTMDECYKLIISCYCKHLISHKLNKLRKIWSQDVPTSVSEDFEFIHKLMSDLCPGVEQWIILLDHIVDIIKTSDIDSMKLSAGAILHRCKNTSLTNDMPLLLVGLLRWKGLPNQKIREVLCALGDYIDPDHIYPLRWYSACFG